MRVSVEAQGGLKRKVTIAVPSAAFEEQIAARLHSAAGELKLPGFRPGKVPLKEVQRRFGAKLRQEVASELLQSSFADAVRQEGLSPAGQAAVEIVNMGAGDDLEFTATFDVLPKVELVDFQTLHIRRPSAQVGEADIDAMVQSLRDRAMRWTPVQRPAAAKDRVIVDYKIRSGGEVVDEAEGEALIVGNPGGIAELGNAVSGMAVGETRTFPATPRDNPAAPDAAAPDTASDVTGDDSAEAIPPSQHPGQSPAGSAIGEVTVRAVEEPLLPEVDDEFMDSLGIEASDGRLERFRAAVRERLQTELNTSIRAMTRREVMTALAEAHDFELPEAMVDAETEAERERLSRLVENPSAELMEECGRTAARRVRTQLVMREIIAQESMEPDDERLRARVEEVASAYENTAEVQNLIYGDEQQLGRFEAAVLEDQVMDHVLSLARIATVQTSYRDVIAGKPLAASADDEDPAELTDESAPPTPVVEVADATEAAASVAVDGAAAAQPMTEVEAADAADDGEKADITTRLRRIFKRKPPE